MSHKPTLHLIGIFHTIHSSAFSHCAFTGKALRFPRMMQEQGWDVIEYSNAGSESQCYKKIHMLSREEFNTLRGTPDPTGFHGEHCRMGNPMHTAFERKLFPALLSNVKPGDIVCHPFGKAHEKILPLLTSAYHVETGIGYNECMPTTFKIYESYAWRHTHIERDRLTSNPNRTGDNYEWVIPNYFDLNEWDVNLTPDSDKYVAFMGRICADKGLNTVKAIAERCPYRVLVAGQGDATPWEHPNLHYVKPLTGMDRSEFIGNAICSIMPTAFVEPFGGSGVEGMLCGTPLLSTDFGAFAETVIPGVTGYRCKTLRNWLDAIEKCASGEISRRLVSEVARNKYSLEACGAQYDEAFSMIAGIGENSWYAGC